MGLGLTLLPLRGPQQMGDVSVLCHDRLSFDQDYEIFGQLSDVGEGNKPTIKANPIPPQMWVETYEDEGIERHRDDKYGTELTVVYPRRPKKQKGAGGGGPQKKE